LYRPSTFETGIPARALQLKYKFASMRMPRWWQFWWQFFMGKSLGNQWSNLVPYEALENGWSLLSSMNTAWFLHGTRRLVSRNPTGSGSHPSTLSAQGKVLILGGKRPPIISQFVFPLSEKWCCLCLHVGEQLPVLIPNFMEQLVFICVYTTVCSQL
jgi:hypothetical protein